MIFNAYDYEVLITQNQYVSGGRAHENLDLMLNCFISITKVGAASSNVHPT